MKSLQFIVHKIVIELDKMREIYFRYIATVRRNVSFYLHLSTLSEPNLFIT